MEPKTFIEQSEELRLAFKELRKALYESDFFFYKTLDKYLDILYTYIHSRKR